MSVAERKFTRTDTSQIEPRYLELLEAGRSVWWSSENFDTWKNLYISEYARGFVVMDMLRQYLPGFELRDTAVLDIGCGDAGVLIAFAETGARAVGVERNGKSLYRGKVRAAEHAVNVHLGAAVAEALPFRDSSFDLVILDNVLEHVQDQKRTLGEIRRVLRPNGVLYLVTPKPFALASLWKDPHYDLAGLVLLPRRLQVWYFERVRGGGVGAYEIGKIPTRWRLRRLLRATGFRSMVSPRELWVRYLRNRISHPNEVRPGIRRKLAGMLMRRTWPFENQIMRWFWDIAVGSNIFIARRYP